jgi:chromosome segregation ATPase
VIGATVGAVADKVMTSKQKELELKDKQAAAEIAQAQTEEERVATANKALDHNQELFNKISEQLAKKQARNEELKDIIEGNKPLPENTTIEEVKKEYVANQQESAQLLQQLGNVRATMDSLTNIIQSGGKN